MSQISKYPISKDVYERFLDIFLEVISRLKSKKEVSEFFSEFLTPTEQIILAKRLSIGFLIENNYNYYDICNVLKVSKCTVGSVSSKYRYGNSFKKVVTKAIMNEGIKNVWLEIIEGISALGSVGGKGTGVWKHLNKKTNKILYSKPF